MKLPKYTPLATLTIAAFAGSLNAGTLRDTYTDYAQNSSVAETARLLSQAAEEQVNIAKKGYHPRMRLQSKYLHCLLYTSPSPRDS